MGTQKRIGNRNARSIAAMGMRGIVRCRTEPGRLCHCVSFQTIEIGDEVHGLQRDAGFI
jgi:hypothetical protein